MKLRYSWCVPKICKYLLFNTRSKWNWDRRHISVPYFFYIHCMQISTLHSKQAKLFKKEDIGTCYIIPLALKRWPHHCKIMLLAKCQVISFYPFCSFYRHLVWHGQGGQLGPIGTLGTQGSQRRPRIKWWQHTICEDLRKCFSQNLLKKDRRTRNTKRQDEQLKQSTFTFRRTPNPKYERNW